MAEDREIYEILDKLGLDDEEIKSINKRNKLLNETTAEEVSDIVNFFSIKCKLDEDDIARVIIKNPFILNESFDRINMLAEIYEKVGFSEQEYKDYIVNCDKAFSANPKDVVSGINAMINSGKEMKAVKELMLDRPDRIF